MSVLALAIASKSGVSPSSSGTSGVAPSPSNLSTSASAPSRTARIKGSTSWSIGSTGASSSAVARVSLVVLLSAAPTPATKSSKLCRAAQSLPCKCSDTAQRMPGSSCWKAASLSSALMLYFLHTSPPALANSSSNVLMVSLSEKLLALMPENDCRSASAPSSRRAAVMLASPLPTASKRGVSPAKSEASGSAPPRSSWRTSWRLPSCTAVVKASS
mmetsp:Transcript_3776/g.7366  ORF Transcript_3776/g.7366 Transcript_3776/m.7366 type:complete len:216 (-) Transcript_3776:1093-1740(-)